MNRVDFMNELKRNPNLVNKITIGPLFCGKATDTEEFCYY